MYNIKILSIISLFATFQTPYNGCAQKLIKDYVVKNSVMIRTIEPGSVDFKDLAPIGDAVGDAKVVMLGEQDHGDAPTFLAKTRLIKYLHEKKGFNVLAFESDFFGLNYGWDKLDKKEVAIDTFLRKNIYELWTLCNTCSELFYDYIPGSYKSKSPLLITGFDSQQFLNYSLNNLYIELDSTLRSLNLPITKQPIYATEILPLINSSKRWAFLPPKDDHKIDDCLGHLSTIKNQLSAKVGPDNLWLLVMDNLIQQVERVKLKGDPKKDDERDIQMAKNLKWLIQNKFKNEKVIVWAANVHIARSLENIQNSYYKNNQTMGEHLVESLPAEKSVYILGFTSLQGTGGRIGSKPFNIYTPRKNSLEGWLGDVGYKYAFVDFNQFNKQYPTSDNNFYMSALFHFSAEGKWNRVYNGLFFIRDIYQCVKIR